jgi:hypothetical protein
MTILLRRYGSRQPPGKDDMILGRGRKLNDDKIQIDGKIEMATGFHHGDERKDFSGEEAGGYQESQGRAMAYSASDMSRLETRDECRVLRSH